MLPLLAVMSFLFMSCKEEKNDSIAFVYDPQTVPTMRTDSLSTLISDSGLVKYKMIAKTWLLFDQAEDPHSLFPDGFYFEQFDSLFNVTATIKADSVWNFTRRKLWQLRGNVSIVNSLGETFTSEELFWDENAQRIYSNQYVEINRPNKTLTKAKRFEANQQMTNYRLYDVISDIYVNDDEEANQQNEE